MATCMQISFDLVIELFKLLKMSKCLSYEGDIDLAYLSGVQLQ